MVATQVKKKKIDLHRPIFWQYTHDLDHIFRLWCTTKQQTIKSYEQLHLEKKKKKKQIDLHQPIFPPADSLSGTKSGSEGVRCDKSFPV